MENLFKIIQNKKLFQSCKKGDVAGVRKALELGANPNAMIPVGVRYDGTSRHKPDWKERVYVHPVILAANAAGHGNEISYQKVVHFLMKHPKTNLHPVVRYYEWDVENSNSASGEPDIKRYYNKSLQDVLNLVIATDQSLSARLSAEQKLYCMPVSMAKYMKEIIENKGKKRRKKKAKNLMDLPVIQREIKQKSKE